MASRALRRLTVMSMCALFVLSNAVAVAAPGDLLWVGRYEQGFRPRAVDVRTNADRVFILGRAPAHEYMVTVAFDRATGAEVWSRVYRGRDGGPNYPRAIEVSADGDTVFVAGASYGGESAALEFVTVAYDAATGVRRWVRRYDGDPLASLDDWPSDLGVTPTGLVFVTGFSFGYETSDDFATIAYDGSTGTRLWTRRYDGPESLIDQAFDMAVSPDGSQVFVTGASHDGGDFDYLTLAYDAATGAPIWRSRLLVDGSDEPISIGVSPSGDAVFVTGSVHQGTPDAEYMTVAYDASTGSDLWASTYGASTAQALAGILGVSATGDVFVAGYADQGMTTVGYDGETGDELWTTHRDDVYAVDLALRPDGTSVFVLTYKGSTFSFDAATGAEEWMTTYDLRDDFGGAGIVASGGGVLYIAAHEKGLDRDRDLVAIAYDVT